MPVISNFYGIIIKMYFQQLEHNPPHIHALYAKLQENYTAKLRRIYYVS